MRKTSYKIGRTLGWINAIEKSAKTRSARPLVARVVNAWIGRNIVSKLWMRSGKK